MAVQSLNIASVQLAYEEMNKKDEARHRSFIAADVWVRVRVRVQVRLGLGLGLGSGLGLET